MINGTKISLDSLKYRRNGSKITMLLETLFLDQTLVSTRSYGRGTFFFKVTLYAILSSMVYIFADVMSDVGRCFNLI